MNHGGTSSGSGPAHGDTSSANGPADGDPGGKTVTCGFCGQEFVEDRSQATCQACPLSKGCSLMRCPHCGYENAKEPGWLLKLKEWIG